MEPKDARVGIWKFIKFVVSHAKISVMSAFIYLMCLMLSLSYMMILPIIYGKILDFGVAHKDLKYIGMLALIIVIALLITSMCDIIAEIMVVQAATGVTNQLRHTLYKHLQSLSYENLRMTSVSQLIQVFSEYLTSIQETIILSASTIVTNALMGIMGFLMLCWLFWPAAIVILVVLITCSILPHFIEAKTQHALDKMVEKKGDLLSAIEEYIMANLIIRLYDLNTFCDKKIYKKFQDTQKYEFQSNAFLAIKPQSMIAGSILSEIMVVVLGAVAVIMGKLSIGLVFSMVVYAAYFFRFASAASFALPLLKKGAIGVENVNAIMEEKRGAEMYHKNLITLPMIEKNIRFENFGCAIDGHKILQNLSFNIPLYRSIAFVGSSGSGKTSILKCLVGLYNDYSGSIKIDDKYELNDIVLESLRKNIAVVTQENYLFDTSIRKNILLGKLDATDEEIIIAAKQAGFYQDIISMPDGFDTMVGKGGQRLSSGQKQRLSLAQALIRKPTILLLDEVTSALDAATEAEINTNLLNYAIETTLIIITHRLNIAMEVDNIYVVDHGKIVEQGNHKELVKKTDGFYAKLWKKQNSVELSVNNELEHIDFAFLRSIDIFSQCTDEILEELIDYLKIETFDKETIIFEQNSIGDKFYIIARGQVEVIKEINATKKTVAILEDGDFFGELSLLRNQVRTATIRTIEPTTTLSLQFYQFVKLFDKQPAIVDYIESFSERRDFSQEQ